MAATTAVNRARVVPGIQLMRVYGSVVQTAGPVLSFSRVHYLMSLLPAG